jgi:hypothetical protein
MGPVSRRAFVEYVRSEGWVPTGRARHGEKRNKAGHVRPIIIPVKREIYPLVIGACLKTMGKSMPDFERWLARR